MPSPRVDDGAEFPGSSQPLVARCTILTSSFSGKSEAPGGALEKKKGARHPALAPLEIGGDAVPQGVQETGPMLISSPPGPLAEADALMVNVASERSWYRNEAVPPSGSVRLLPGELFVV